MTKNYLDKLKEQKAKIEERIRQVGAREKVKERKEDTRRKILLGAYHLEKAKQDNTMDTIKKIMDKYLTRESDRKLFDLPIKEEN